MVLTYDAYNETVEQKEVKDREIEELKTQVTTIQEAQKESVYPRMNYTCMQELSDPSNDKDQKQKLTLGISKDVIERAKVAGVNISAVTEYLLRAITYQPRNGNTDDDVANAYSALLGAAADILDQYNTSFEIGRLERYVDVNGQRVLIKRPLQYYPPAGIIDDDYREYEIQSVLDCLYEPHMLLQNLISALLKSAERNKEKIRELEFALRFVKVLSDDSKKNFEQ
jgi:uncharacterized protein (DUF4415 family)